MVRPGARVLDVGCGEGELLEHLAREKGVDGRGLEISRSRRATPAWRAGWRWCRATPTRDLAEYPAPGLRLRDPVSQTIQQMRAAAARARRSAAHRRRAIVSLPNFGHWRIRLSPAGQGPHAADARARLPWYDTPNIHLCTIADFVALAKEHGAEIERAVAMTRDGGTRAMQPDAWGPNMFAEGAIFLLKGK